MPQFAWDVPQLAWGETQIPAGVPLVGFRASQRSKPPSAGQGVVPRLLGAISAWGWSGSPLGSAVSDRPVAHDARDAGEMHADGRLPRLPVTAAQLLHDGFVSQELH
jgi:hypothetical protein